jgi:hypothetical protein
MDKGLLNDATSSDDSPTPGYMFGEISSTDMRVLKVLSNYV